MLAISMLHSSLMQNIIMRGWLGVAEKVAVKIVMYVANYLLTYYCYPMLPLPHHEFTHSQQSTQVRRWGPGVNRGNSHGNAEESEPTIK